MSASAVVLPKPAGACSTVSRRSNSPSSRSSNGARRTYPAGGSGARTFASSSQDGTLVDAETPGLGDPASPKDLEGERARSPRYIDTYTIEQAVEDKGHERPERLRAGAGARGRAGRLRPRVPALQPVDGHAAAGPARADVQRRPPLAGQDTGQLFSQEFDEKVEALATDDAKASEMEHAIRHEINVRVEENPAFHQSLRERLEEIIEQRRQERLDAAQQLSRAALSPEGPSECDGRGEAARRLAPSARAGRAATDYSRSRRTRVVVPPSRVRAVAGAGDGVAGEGRRRDAPRGDRRRSRLSRPLPRGGSLFRRTGQR